MDILRIPWRVAAADRDADGDSELIISHGGDFNAQWILGFDGVADRGISPLPHWVSKEQLFTSSLRTADILFHDDVEVLAATYYGALKPPNSGHRGSGIVMYRAPPRERPPKYTRQWIIPGEVLLPCAQINDFQVVDLDLDGDLDIIAAVKSLDTTCEDANTASPYHTDGPIYPVELLRDQYIKPDKLLEIMRFGGGYANPSTERDFRSLVDPVRPLTNNTLRDLATSHNSAGDGLFERGAASARASTGRKSLTAVLGAPEAQLKNPTYPENISLKPTDEDLLPSSPTRPGVCDKPPAPPPAIHPPEKLTKGRPILAVFKNSGDAKVPRFGVTPDWFTYISHEDRRRAATALELFDVDQDGHLDIIVGIEQHPTYVILGDTSGPRAKPGGFLTMDQPGALPLNTGDDLAGISILAALLQKPGDDHARVHLAEARSCHNPDNSCCESAAHAVIHPHREQLLDITWPSHPSLQALSVHLTQRRSGEPLLLLGRGDLRPDTGLPELAPHPIDAFDIYTGEATPYTLIETEHSALHMATLARQQDEPRSHQGAVRGGALTLPGVGPMKVDSISVGGVDIPACGPNAGTSCYWSVGASTLLLVGSPPEGLAQVRYRAPSHRGVAVADSRLARHAVVAWQVAP